MQLKGSQILIKTLIEQGVTDVFGYPGGQVINIYDALYEYKDQINHVLTAHEQGASHAADGYSRRHYDVVGEGARNRRQQNTLSVIRRTL